MNVTADELAGVVDLFGGLTRGELERALSEAAFRVDGGSIDEAALEETLEAALHSYALLEFEQIATTATATATTDKVNSGDDQPVFVAGPTAFPTLPSGAEDVPHILDIEPRQFDRERLGERARERLLEDLTAAIAADDADRCRRLLDVSYDLEAWAPIDLDDERRRLEAALD
ncbi:hypothetical protein D8Y22_09925 [Salinadaptatus halalkaliphilus]|uniref:Uncharacterized protein n=1 Tax=Salinadaptatus halalkaliphilus TaxID=2419781 RepID=A0A4V3VLA6_9EURY|nr:hypothetical protein [Salinadaptatus halalkaliphilus]THE64927.1 hypothetical protein D8Y22_09925 [Salinadaptatus halalkaliphilus]